MLSFVPYFAFGCSLYLVTQGARTAWIVLLLSIPAIIWQRMAQQPPEDALSAIQPSLVGNLIVLIVLLSVMTALASSNIDKWRSTDRMFGNITYPLYLYHEDVLVLILTFTTGYSYAMFSVGVVLSVLVAVILMALVDPAVAKYRDHVRGRSLQRFDHWAERPHPAALPPQAAESG
jgi:peptidoglycan/LPS O-acetylase OafA/YrhL